MQRVTDYEIVIVTAPSMEEMRQGVKTLIQQGWQPYGHYTVMEDYQGVVTVCHAMVKYAPDVDVELSVESTVRAIQSYDLEDLNDQICHHLQAGNEIYGLLSVTYDFEAKKPLYVQQVREMFDAGAYLGIRSTPESQL